MNDSSNRLVADRAGLAAVWFGLRQVIDVGVRFPESPFLKSGTDSWCEYERLLGDWFAPFLGSLSTQYGDAYVLGGSVDPSTEYYRENYDSFATFRIPRDEIVGAYGQVISAAPNGESPGALLGTSRVFCVAGSSGSWAIWGEHWLSLAVVHTVDSDMSWRNGSDWFVSTDEAISWFVEPNWRDGVLPAGMREALHDNFNSIDRPR